MSPSPTGSAAAPLAGKDAAQPSISVPFPVPYPASWVDLLQAWVESLPIPWWLCYLLLAVLLCGLVALGLWRTGVYAAVGFHPMQVWLPMLAAYLLGLTHGLDLAAEEAMRRFRPAFRGDDDEFRGAVYRITTLPARPVLIFTLAATLVTLPFGRFEMSMLQTGGLERSPLLFDTILAVMYLISYPFFYHVWHQLREIHRLHRNWATARLSNVRPMHALSRISVLTALGIVIFNYGWFLAQPGADPDNPVTIVETLFNLVIVLIVFLWPLWGAHRMLVDAKEQTQTELARRTEATRAQLHQAVDAGQLERVDPLHKALTAPQAETAELARIATWPWAPGTLRNLVGAVFLPVILWLIQYGLGKVLG